MQTVWGHQCAQSTKSLTRLRTRRKFELRFDTYALAENDHDFIMSNNSEHVDSNVKAKQNTKHQTEKTFEELVEESIRLPSLSHSNQLPMTMTEILRSSQKSKDIATKLPQIHSGKVQLVTRSDGLPGERKRRRGHKTKLNRPERPSPGVPSDNKSTRVTVARPPAGLTDKNHAKEQSNTEQANWKKKLHRRQSKRRIAEDTDPLNVPITISGYQNYNGYRT